MYSLSMRFWRVSRKLSSLKGDLPTRHYSHLAHAARHGVRAVPCALVRHEGR